MTVDQRKKLLRGVHECRARGWPWPAIEELVVTLVGLIDWLDEIGASYSVDEHATVWVWRTRAA
jgi:hypothetical protein